MSFQGGHYPNLTTKLYPEAPQASLADRAADALPVYCGMSAELYPEASSHKKYVSRRDYLNAILGTEAVLDAILHRGPAEDGVHAPTMSPGSETIA